MNLPQKRDTQAYDFVNKHLFINVTTWIEFMGQSEDFQNECPNDYRDLIFGTDLEKTYETLLKNDNFLFISTDRPISEGWTPWNDYALLHCWSILHFSDDYNRLDCLVEFYYGHLNYDDVLDGDENDMDFESDEVLREVLAPAVQNYLDTNNMYLVKYDDHYCLLEEPQEIADGSTVDKMLQDLKENNPEYVLSERREFATYWIVEQYTATCLEQKGEMVVYLFNQNIWVRNDCGQAIYKDEVIQDIAFENKAYV